MLAEPVAPQRFEPIGRWNAKIGKTFGSVEQAELSQGNGLNIPGKPTTAVAFPDRGNLLVAKARDHV